jgi:hypothetical protein
MEHAKKMILVEPAVYEKTHQLRPTLPNTISQLDEEMNDVLSNKNIGDHEKWTRYSQVLQRYLHMVKVARKPFEITVTNTQPVPDNDVGQKFDTPLSDGEILSCVPKTFQSKAEVFLKKLKNTPSITWDNRGVVSIENIVIPDSNVTDLINDILRHRKSMPDPKGWQIFAEALKSINMPFEVIGNWKRRAFISNQRTGEKDFSSSPETPNSRESGDKNSPYKMKKRRGKSGKSSDARNQATPQTSFDRSIKWSKLNF